MGTLELKLKLLRENHIDVLGWRCPYLEWEWLWTFAYIGWSLACSTRLGSGRVISRWPPKMRNLTWRQKEIFIHHVTCSFIQSSLLRGWSPHSEQLWSDCISSFGSNICEKDTIEQRSMVVSYAFGTLTHSWRNSTKTNRK